MDILAKLFGSAAKVKIMRLFLFNPDKPYINTDIAQKAQVSVDVVRKTTNLLAKIGFLKKKLIYKRSASRSSAAKTGTKTATGKKMNGWVLDRSFLYLPILHKLLVNTGAFTTKDIKEKLKPIGKLRLVVISGVFLQEWDMRLDLLLVGDGLKKSEAARIVRGMEAEIGTELTYALFNTEEFLYRINVRDKLVRDIFDYSHEVILNRLPSNVLDLV
jgi:hypothetical protein